MKIDNLSANDFIPDDAVDEPAAVSRESNESVVGSTIADLVKSHPDGITTSDILQALSDLEMKSTRPTVLRILRDLEAAREVYAREGVKPILWFPNGKLVHPYLEMFRETGGKTFRGTVQRGRHGPAIQLQERTFSLMSGERIDGAVFIPWESVEDILELLVQLRERYKNLESTMGR